MTFSTSYLNLFFNSIEENNKLKFINGKTFAKLTKLRTVWLSSNQCINEDFNVPSRIAVLQQTFNEKCSFDEEDQQKEECENIARTLEAQTKTFNQALENKTAEIIDVNKKLAKSEAQLESQTMLKINEIERLNEELQRKNEEIIEKREKIKTLEEKVELMLNVTSGIYK